MQPEQVELLYVEDDPGFADLAVTCLDEEDDRFSITTATDAATGLQRLTDDIDCIVSDYNMPGMDGIEFLERVRETHPQLPFILFTGKGSEEVASEAISAGVTDYLQKEGGTDQFTVLANRITNAVERHRAQENLTRQNERLDTVVTNAPLILFALDSDGVFTFSEGKGLAEIDMESGDVVGDSVFDVFADDDDILAAAEQALDGEQTTAIHEVAGSIFETTYNPVFDDDGTVSSAIGVAVDITEAHEREQDLHQFKEAIEATSHSIYITDPDGTIEYVNPAFESTTGYTAEEAIGRNPRILKSGEHDEELYEELWETIRAGDTWQGELVNSTKDDDRYGVNQTITPVTTDEGEITNFVAVNADITERRQREHRFEALVEESNDIISVLDADGVIQYNSPSLERILGHDPEKTIGDTVWKSIHPDDREAVVDTFEEWMAEPETTTTVEYRAKHADGSWRWMEARGTNQRDNPAVEGYVVNSRDITEHKERERELEILRTASDHAHIPLILTDPSQPDNPMVYVNDAFEEVTGYSRSEAIGNNCRFLQGEQTDPEQVAEVRDAIENGEPATVELRNYRKDGTMFWNRVSIRPIYDEDGELLRYFGSQQDITEQKESRDRVEQQNERLDEFASVISHDLRNPLRVAESRLELASEDCESDHLAAVADAHDRMETLIEDLLTLAREGTRVDEMEPVPVRTVAEKCWQTVETEAATLTIDTEQTLKADPTRFQQLLENLVRNAIDHGGDDVHIVVGECNDGTGLYVTDDGPGIPEGDRETVFDSGYSSDPDGTGFGLAIVKEIVHNHGWDIEVTESEAGGARFEISDVEAS
jgi:PAS domain S-box-containing protein